MCIFSGAVESVSNTRIFVTLRRSDASIVESCQAAINRLIEKDPDCGVNGGHALADTILAFQSRINAAKKRNLPARQLTIYGNNVDIADNNRVAMILPVPGDAKDVKIEVELQKVSDSIFKECAKAFEDSGWGRSAEGFCFGGTSKSYVPVVRAGSYDVSICATIEDLTRINPEKLTVDAGVLATIAKEYPVGYAFLVCQLKPKAKENVPFAYTHAAMADGSCFVPCLHVHAGEEAKHTTRDWDHTIYYYGASGIQADVVRSSLKEEMDAGSLIHGVGAELPKVVVRLLSSNCDDLKDMKGGMTLVQLKIQHPYVLNGDISFYPSGRLPRDGWKRTARIEYKTDWDAERREEQKKDLDRFLARYGSTADVDIKGLSALQEKILREHGGLAGERLVEAAGAGTPFFEIESLPLTDVERKAKFLADHVGTAVGTLPSSGGGGKVISSRRTKYKNHKRVSEHPAAQMPKLVPPSAEHEAMGVRLFKKSLGVPADTPAGRLVLDEIDTELNALPIADQNQVLKVIGREITRTTGHTVEIKYTPPAPKPKRSETKPSLEAEVVHTGLDTAVDDDFPEMEYAGVKTQ